MLDANTRVEKIWKHSYGPTTRPEIDPLPFKHLAHMVRGTATTYADRTAFSVCLPNGMSADLSYAEVDLYSDYFALYLREKLGLSANDRVAVQMPNCLAYAVVAFGIFKAGCVLVNTNPLYTVPEMVHQLKDCRPKALVIIDLFGDKVAPTRKEAAIPHVILVRLTEFFPAARRLLIGTVMKLKGQIPACKSPYIPFADTMSDGGKIYSEKKCRTDKTLLERYLADTHLESMAVLQYTGGTTGVSKGAVLSHRSLLSNVCQVLEHEKTTILPGQEVILTALPLYHIFSFTVNLITFFYIGSHIILSPSPRPITNLKAAFEKYPLTWMTGLNTLFNALVNESWFVEHPPAKMKCAIAGGTALHSAVAEKWSRVTHSTIAEGYGLTEASPVVSFNPLAGVIKRDTIGIPIPSTEVVILGDDGKPCHPGESGELCIRGPQLMSGYWEKEEETRNVLKDGWLHTGDVATMDDQGYLRIVDRKKDMINVSGFKVFPNEVEARIAEHPGVSEVAVVGIKDEHTGEGVKAFIVKKDPNLTVESVRAFCGEALAKYKVPKVVEFRKDLPKTPVGKILRKELRA